jgi:hypothetical protein
MICWSRSGRRACALFRPRAGRERAKTDPTDARISRAVAFGAALVGAWWLAQPALADEAEGESSQPAKQQAPREPDWIPSLETGFETFDYNTKSEIQNFVNPPSWSGQQHHASRQLMYRIGGELMGPAFESLPGDPRLFVSGGVQLRTFSSDSIFQIGDPGVALQPERDVSGYENIGNRLGRNLPFEFIGQGSDINASLQDPSWYASLGVAFSVPIGNNLLLQIKPSIDYSLETIDFFGRLTTVLELDPHEDPDFDVPTRTFVISRGRQKASTDDHSVGIGTELAMVLFRNLRPIRVSLYSEARCLWVVSGRTTDFADVNGGTTFSVTRDSFDFRGGGGIRFSWVGFD